MCATTHDTGTPRESASAWDDPHFQLAATHFGHADGDIAAEGDTAVISLAQFLRETFGEWTVKASDYDRLSRATRELRQACKHRLPPGHYGLLEKECGAIDAILAANSRNKYRGV